MGGNKKREMEMGVMMEGNKERGMETVEGDEKNEKMKKVRGTVDKMVEMRVMEMETVEIKAVDFIFQHFYF